MPPSHCWELCLWTNTNWHLLRIAQHRIDSNYLVLIRCHFRISSYCPCESKSIRIASYCIAERRINSCQFLSVRISSLYIRIDSLYIRTGVRRLSVATQYVAIRCATIALSYWIAHARIGSCRFLLVPVVFSSHRSTIVTKSPPFAGDCHSHWFVQLFATVGRRLTVINHRHPRSFTDHSGKLFTEIINVHFNDAGNCDSLWDRLRMIELNNHGVCAIRGLPAQSGLCRHPRTGMYNKAPLRLARFSVPRRGRRYRWAARFKVRSHVRFVRNPHGLLHFWLVTFQQEWSHGVHCGAVRPANQAKKLPQPRCQKLPQRPLRLKRDSPNSR